MRTRLLYLNLFILLWSLGMVGDTNAVWPISNLHEPFADPATSPFGPRDENTSPVQYDYGFHEGLDVQAYYDSVHAIQPGEVVISTFSALPGHYIRILTGDHYFQYLHLSERLAQVGDMVSSGEVIGISGETGQASGPHLHIGFIPWVPASHPYHNPLYWLPWTNDDCPVLTLDTIEMDYSGEYIDWLKFKIEVPYDELDIGKILVYLLHDTFKNLCVLDYKDISVVNNNTGIFHFFAGGGYWDTWVTLIPKDFNKFNNQILELKVDVSDGIFRDSAAVGVRIVDIGGFESEGYQCFQVFLVVELPPAGKSSGPE